MIDVVEGSRKIEKFAKLTGADAAVVALPSWLSRETGSLKGVVTKLPERSDIDFDVQEHLIVGCTPSKLSFFITAIYYEPARQVLAAG